MCYYTCVHNKIYVMGVMPLWTHRSYDKHVYSIFPRIVCNYGQNMKVVNIGPLRVWLVYLMCFTAHRHSKNYVHNIVNLILGQTCFALRVVKTWNNLPEHIISAPTVNSFKNRIDKHWAGQELLYNSKSEILWNWNCCHNWILFNVVVYLIPV